MAAGGEGWTEQRVMAVKQRTKTAVDTLLANGDAASTLAELMRRIAAPPWPADDTPDLNRFIHIVSVLLLHERSGGLTTTEINQLVALGTALLRANGIKSETSRLCFLYGELHLALSQIYRRSGDPWQATWEHQLAVRLSRRVPPGGKGFQSLALGNRALRLGESRLALEQLAIAETNDLPPHSREQARVLRVHALRVSGALAAARQLLSETQATMPASVETRRDLDWEALCLEVATSGDLNPLLAAIRKGRPHCIGSFVLEVCLWCLASQSRSWLDRIPRFETLARKAELDVAGHATATVARCVRRLLECYDSDIPFTLRLGTLSLAVSEAKSLITVDKELLLWVAATRWLARNSYHDMAALTCAEYVALSRRLSDTKTSDVLGIAGDLVARVADDALPKGA